MVVVRFANGGDVRHALAREIAREVGEPTLETRCGLAAPKSWWVVFADEEDCLAPEVTCARCARLGDVAAPRRIVHASPRALVVRPGASLAEVEREAILQTLELCGGNKSAAARSLGISRRALYDKLAEYAGEAATATAGVTGDEKEGPT